jgi:hypothetical protein
MTPTEATDNLMGEATGKAAGQPNEAQALPRIRPQSEFPCEPGTQIEVMPGEGYRGCYLFRRDETPAANPPNTYTLILYVDRGLGPVTCVVTGNKHGFVVDVPEGYRLNQLRDFLIKEYGNNTPKGGGPGTPGTIKTNPPSD